MKVPITFDCSGFGDNLHYYHVSVLVKTKNETQFRSPEHIDYVGKDKIRFAWDIAVYPMYNKKNAELARKKALQKARYLSRSKNAIKVTVSSQMDMNW